VVLAELGRLDSRLPELDERSRAEITQTVRRVVDKLLHAPTVRVKQLAAEPGGASYADALRELFDLDPAAVHAVSGTPGAPQQPAQKSSAPQQPAQKQSAPQPSAAPRPAATKPGRQKLGPQNPGPDRPANGTLAGEVAR
jgi:hypothetical protein